MRTVVIYMDEKGRETTKDKAVRALGLKIDDKGEVVERVDFVKDNNERQQAK